MTDVIGALAHAPFVVFLFVLLIVCAAVLAVTNRK